MSVEIRDSLLVKTILSPILNFTDPNEDETIGKETLVNRVHHLRYKNRVALMAELKLLSEYLHKHESALDLKEKGACLLLIDERPPKERTLWTKICEFVYRIFGSHVSSKALIEQLSSIRKELICEGIRPLNIDVNLGDVWTALMREKQKKIDELKALKELKKSRKIPEGMIKIIELNKSLYDLKKQPKDNNYTLIVQEISDIIFFFKNEVGPFAEKKAVISNLKALQNFFAIFMQYGESTTAFATAITSRKLEFKEIINNKDVLIPFSNAMTINDTEKREAQIVKVLITNVRRVTRAIESRLNSTVADFAPRKQELRDTKHLISKRLRKLEKIKQSREATVFTQTQTCDGALGYIKALKNELDHPLADLQKSVHTIYHVAQGIEIFHQMLLPHTNVTLADSFNFLRGVFEANAIEATEECKNSIYIRIYKDKLESEIYERLKHFSYELDSEKGKKQFLQDYLTYLQVAISSLTKL